MWIVQLIGIVVVIAVVIVGVVWAWRKYKGATSLTNAIGKIEAKAAMLVVKQYLNDIAAALTVCDQVDTFIDNHVVTKTDVTEDSAAAITALSSQVAELQKQLATIKPAG